MISIADLHLGNEKHQFSKSGVPIQRLAVRERLHFIGSYCRQTKQALAVMGDVFNRVNPKTEVIAEWFRFLSEFRDVLVFVIGGNHDASVLWANTEMLSRADLPNVTVITEAQVLEVEDSSGSAMVLFYPHVPLGFRETSPSMEEMMALGPVDFVVTHGQVSSSEYANDIFFEAGDALEINMDTLPDDALVLAGHIHNQKTYHGARGVRVMYPGSLTINNFGEVEEEQGYIEIPLKAPEAVHVKQFPTDSVVRWQHVELDLTEKDERDLNEEQVAEIADGALIKITVFAKAYGVVDESYIRALFNKYGYVVKYETKVTTEKVETKEVQKTMSHEALLSDWLEGTDDLSPKVKKKVMAVGSEIIAEVLS